MKTFGPASALVSLACLAPVLQDPAPAAVPGAVVTDAAGTTVTVAQAAFVQEESEGGTLYVTKLPYLPLQTGRGEWRIPIGSIRRIDVTPPAAPASLRRAGEWRARLRVRLPDEGLPAVSTATSSGLPALDAALGMAAARLSYAPSAGQGAVTARPVELEATVRLQEVTPPPPRELPVLTLHLRNGETATGRATGPLTLEGERGAGTYRLPLRDCRRIEFGE